MAKKQQEPEAAATEQVITAYKGFDTDWKCRGFQFEIGKSYEHQGAVKSCASGFHACENPIDMFSYYTPGESKFALVELSGEFSRHDEDSKIAAGKITIKAELSIPTIVEKTIAWIAALCVPANAEHATGDRSASSATGDRSASSATGDRSASSATGDRSASSATGYRSASSATGYSSASSATGDRSASSATGDRSASSATGYRSASSATGYRSASSATGDRSASSATGDRSASSATGYRSASSASGIGAVALNTGKFGKAKASEGGAIVLCEHADDGSLLHIRSSKVGENGVKPDVWYRLENNEFVEAAQ